MRGLRLKIILLTLLPLLFVMATISVVAIYSKSQSERQSVMDRISTYRNLLESGNLSFDTAQDKNKLKQIIGEEVIIAELLRSDYSVVYSSENSPAPLITEEERPLVDSAFLGYETVVNQVVQKKPILTDIAPLVVNGKIVAVIHMQLSNAQSSERVAQYALFIILLTVLGMLLCFVLVYSLLARVVVNNISKLREATVEIRKGHLDEKIDIKTNDEIGELATSFNLMTQRLLDSQRAIDAKIRELSVEHGKLSSLVESVKLGVVMVDLSLNVVLSNPAARLVFGKSTSSELQFRDISEMIKSKVNISQALSSYVKSGKPLNIQEVMIGERYFRLFMSPVRDIEQKTFIGAVFVMEDISEEKKLDRMRSEIVSITSHQLRTPATIVKGNLEMIMGGDFGKVSKEQKELLEDTYMGNERMIRLVNDLMDASKIDEGKFELPSELLDLQVLVGEVVKEVSPLAVKKNVKLDLLSSTKSLPPVKINKQKVKQVLQNLIDNAIKYSSSSPKGEVHVAVTQVDKNIQFQVRDNGIGIPVADQDHIFERFYRGSNSTKLDPGGGSGLGLYIARGVVQQAGGKIWFESKEGEGTSFFVTFPAANAK